jgi:hypothetical protein
LDKGKPAIGDVAVGSVIYFDRESPESTRLLALHGVEVILASNACGVGKQMLDQMATRALEKWVDIAMAFIKTNGRLDELSQHREGPARCPSQPTSSRTKTTRASRVSHRFDERELASLHATTWRAGRCARLVADEEGPFLAKFNITRSRSIVRRHWVQGRKNSRQRLASATCTNLTFTGNTCALGRFDVSIW